MTRGGPPSTPPLRRPSSVPPARRASSAPPPPLPRGSIPAGRASAPPSAKAAVSTKAMELARGFLSALFMGVRTAQIHDPGNKAFENAVMQVRETAQALFAVTGAFSIQFVEESAFLNGARIRFDGGAYDSMKKLRGILEGRGMGGVEMQTPPSPQAVRSLILGFSPKAQLSESLKVELAAQQIGLLGVQTFADGAKGGLRIDRRVFAAQCYAKLILAVREQQERAQQELAGTAEGRPPRLRAVRVIQDLVELCGDRMDFLLRLGVQTHGAEPESLAAASTCTLSIAMGHALGISRQELVDLGVAALFHNLGRSIGEPTLRLGARAAFSRLLRAGRQGRNGYLRAVLVAEQGTIAGDALPWGGGRPRPHLFARIIGVAAGYSALVLGCDPARDGPVDPMIALQVMARDRTGRFDARIVDLLINLLRTYPAGTEVRLDTGDHAFVKSQIAGSRWDRPIVTVTGPEPRSLDLMRREGGRFVARIEETIFPPSGRSAPFDLEPEPLPDSALGEMGTETLDTPMKLELDNRRPSDSFDDDESLVRPVEIELSPASVPEPGLPPPALDLPLVELDLGVPGAAAEIDLAPVLKEAPPRLEIDLAPPTAESPALLEFEHTSEQDPPMLIDLPPPVDDLRDEPIPLELPELSSEPARSSAEVASESADDAELGAPAERTLVAPIDQSLLDPDLDQGLVLIPRSDTIQTVVPQSPDPHAPTSPTLSALGADLEPFAAHAEAHTERSRAAPPAATTVRDPLPQPGPALRRNPAREVSAGAQATPAPRRVPSTTGRLPAPRAPSSAPPPSRVPSAIGRAPAIERTRAAQPDSASVTPALEPAVRPSSSPHRAGGKVLGRYELIEPVSGGKVARTFHGRSSDGTAVWVERSPLSPAARVELETRAEVLQELSHPALPRLIEVGTEAEHGIVVFEAIEGLSLAELLEADATLSADAARRIVRAIAEGVHELHLRRVHPQALGAEQVFVAPGEQAVLATPGRLLPLGDSDALQDQAALGRLLLLLLAVGADGSSGALSVRLDAIAKRMSDPDPKRRFPSLQAAAIALTRLTDPIRGTHD